MNITRETHSYNQRRYGKPWIAKVDFSGGPKGDFSFGEWAGDHYNGGAGVLEIAANPGDIIAIGQKDFRKASNSAPDFFVVDAAGNLNGIGDKGSAYKHYKSAPAIDRDALAAERERLSARIAEIDSLLAE